MCLLSKYIYIYILRLYLDVSWSLWWLLCVNLTGPESAEIPVKQYACVSGKVFLSLTCKSIEWVNRSLIILCVVLIPSVVSLNRTKCWWASWQRELLSPDCLPPGTCFCHTFGPKLKHWLSWGVSLPTSRLELPH